LFTESALCEEDLLEWKIHFFDRIFRFVCNVKFTYLVQNLVSVYDAKSSCSAHYLAPFHEFCRSLTVSNEQILSVKIIIYDKLRIFTCDVGVCPVLALRDPGFFHRRFNVFCWLQLEESLSVITTVACLPRRLRSSSCLPKAVRTFRFSVCDKPTRHSVSIYWPRR